jgi:hypothetical protein
MTEGLRGADRTEAAHGAPRPGVVCPYCLVEVRPRYAAVSWRGAAYHARCLDALLGGARSRLRDEAA